MRTIKDFLIAMCEVENIKAKELQQLTGKSQSVVYEWLNSSNITNFPTYESLSKILCRLGLTMDEFLKCKSDKLVDYSKFRTYSNYLCSKNVDEFSLSEKRLTFSRTVMEALNYENILNCYINDCLELKKMITLYLKGIKVDTDKFDLLCNNIKPFVISDIEFFDEAGGVGYYLNSSNVYDFKIRTEAYKENVEDDPDYAVLSWKAPKGDVYRYNIYYMTNVDADYTRLTYVGGSYTQYMIDVTDFESKVKTITFIVLPVNEDGIEADISDAKSVKFEL